MEAARARVAVPVRDVGAGGGKSRRTKSQGPGLVNVLVKRSEKGPKGHPQQLIHDLRPAPSRTRLLKGLQNRTSTNPGSWPEVVNESMWVAAKRTFTIPGSWPLNL